MLARWRAGRGGQLLKARMQAGGTVEGLQPQVSHSYTHQTMRNSTPISLVKIVLASAGRCAAASRGSVGCGRQHTASGRQVNSWAAPACMVARSQLNQQCSSGLPQNTHRQSTAPHSSSMPLCLPGAYTTLHPSQLPAMQRAERSDAQNGRKATYAAQIIGAGEENSIRAMHGCMRLPRKMQPYREQLA